MTPYFFGLGPGHLSARVRRIVETHGAIAINYTEPSGEKRHWCECPNLGAPFDERTAREVLAAIADARRRED